jgi:hypothetical protein
LEDADPKLWKAVWQQYALRSQHDYRRCLLSFDSATAARKVMIFVQGGVPVLLPRAAGRLPRLEIVIAAFNPLDTDHRR